LKERSIVGDLINFRGLVYSPTNENGVIFLFGKVMEDQNMYIEEIKPGFPDCIGRRFTGRGWERVYIEFEYKSSNFDLHKHDPKDCDIIVCWEHDWVQCPLEVIELSEIIKSLPNKPIQRPEIGPDERTVEEYLKAFPEKIAKIFGKLDECVKALSDEIWRKAVRPPGVNYYSPEKVFMYMAFQKQGLRLNIFTRGEKIERVKSFDYAKGGIKWGKIYVSDENQLEGVISIIKKSYDLIREAIKNNETTCWFADLGAEDTKEANIDSETD
jgi:hypothetical protein